MKEPGRRRARWIKVALLVGSVTLSVALGELAVRVAASLPSSEPESSYPVLTQYDSLLGWSPIPNAEGERVTREYRVNERLDSFGIRGGPHEVPKPAGEFRVLLLGDSFTEGYSVGLSDLVSTRLESQLEAIQARPSTVVNAGVRGYSTDQELLYFEAFANRYQADVVVLLFFVNDVWFNNTDWYWRGSKPRFLFGPDSTLELTNVPVPRPDHASPPVREPLPGDGFFSFFNDHSELYRTSRRAVGRSPFLSGIKARFGYVFIPPEWRPWRRVPSDTMARAWRMTGALLRSLEVSVRQAGGRLVIVHVPAPEAVYSEDWKVFRRRYALSDRDWNPMVDAVMLGDICRENDFDCLFLLGSLRQAADSLDAERLYYPGDRHWNALGHDLAARTIARHIATHEEAQ